MVAIQTISRLSTFTRQNAKTEETLYILHCRSKRIKELYPWELAANHTHRVKVGFEVEHVLFLEHDWTVELYLGPPRKRRVMTTTTTTKHPPKPHGSKHHHVHFRRHHRCHHFRPRYRPRYGQRSLPWKSHQHKNLEVMCQLQLVEK